MFEAVTQELDSPKLAGEAITAHRMEHLRIGAERLALAAHWCDLHPAEDDLPQALRTRKQPRRSGADGTPEVSEFAGHELGCLLGIHTHAAMRLMADAVNLRHRHPQLWARTMDGQVVDWLSRKTATLVAAAGLTESQAQWVDSVTAPYATTLPPGRYLALVEARIIEADPVAAERRAELRALDRFVRTGQSDEHGIKTLVARAMAGDIIYLVAVIDRLAQILELRGDTDSADVRRSKALGLLATPTKVLELLAWAERDEPEQPLDDLAEALSTIDPDKLCPEAVLYVHISREAIEAGLGVARVEGVGPVPLGQLHSLLRNTRITLQPVVDLEGGMPVDAYEIPDRMRQALILRHPFEVFPWGTIRSRKTDHDHTKPYVRPDRGGPPGQTHPDLIGPLSRRHHRAKTHGVGWRHHQLSPGVHLWRTPSGYWYRVDRDGTHHLGKDISVLEQRLATLLAA